MLTLKRLYLYTVLGIALAVLLVGVNDVIRIALDQLGDAFDSRSYVSEDVRTELSWALALAIVAAPVFAVHLGLVRRTLKGPAPSVADERASASRATYFFLVLAGTGIVAIVHLADLVQVLTGSLVFGDRPWGLAAATAGSLVAGGAWVLHLWARGRDLRAAPERTAGDWLTRGYLYGALFLVAILACIGIGNLLTVAGRVLLDLQPAWQRADWWQEEITWPLALGLVTLAAWAIHWLLASRLLRAPEPMGEAHRTSRTRRGYFPTVALACAAATLIAISMGLSSAFAELAGTWRPTDGSRLLEEVGGPLLLAVPFVLTWWWHLRRAAAEGLAFGGAERARTARRTGRLAVAFVGLAGLAIGLAWELQALLDAIASSGQEALFTGDEVGEISTSALAAALVGLVIWAPAWALSGRDRARDVTESATATERRAYLFLVSGTAVVALMLALAFVIYQASRMALGTEPIDDASWALAVLVVSAIALAYHVHCLRADLLVAGAAERTTVPATHEVRAIETIEISAPAGADFKVLNAAIRTELPEGYELRVVS